MRTFYVLTTFVALAIHPLVAGETKVSPATPRAAFLLSEGWKFIKREALPDEKTDQWETVSTPHTWNVTDGADGKEAEPELVGGYYRGPAWYEHKLSIPPEWKGKRVFLRFEGVSTVADVIVNGVPLGQHRGGFSAFCYEITRYLRFDGNDDLKVRADNSRAFDIAPLSGDFTVFGGIYRPVTLFATDELCISPIESASPGLFATLKELDKEQAFLDVESLVSNGSSAALSAVIAVDIKDAEGNIIAKVSQPLELPAGGLLPVVQKLVVRKPRLWNGRIDPYLYSVTARLMRDGTPVDEVAIPLGIRTVSISQEEGFLLNGKPYPLHGVSRHQDIAGKGWALSDRDHEADHKLIREMGATTIRLAHYPQAETFHKLSDRTGIIEWQEIPLVDSVGGSPRFLENARQQLTEMILQNRQHPSIAMWGLWNELESGASGIRTAPAIPVIENLKKLAVELDPSRPTVAASFRQNANARHQITDAIAWNIYPGWYAGTAEDAAGWIKKYSGQVCRRIGISEYGAGANPDQHEEGTPTNPVTTGSFHPQEWQNHVHERLWSQLQDNPQVWGTWAWAMFDFASDSRNEGEQPGVNDKGLVTRDRKTKKDTYYFYQANWSGIPMLHITSQGMTPRAQATTDIKVYSNCPEVDLRLNGVSLGRLSPDRIHSCVWKNVPLRPGENTIEATATTPNGPLAESCLWVLKGPGDGSH